MARRPKRASMREGPLADLFRSTEAPDDPPEPPARPEPRREREERPAPEPEPQAAAPEPEPEPVAESAPPAPAEPAPAPSAPRREPKDRLRDVFSHSHPDREDREAAYGRGEPSGRISAMDTPEIHDPVIRVVGVGGGGVNAVNRMVEAGISGVEFMAVNTDLQSLQSSAADVTVHIGGGVTRGLGSGSDPELGYRAAFEEQDRIKRMLKGSDMIFVAAGAGGGTGTGAAPVIARLARDVGALTVGIVTKPFSFEGSRRAKQAEKGVEALAEEVDTLIVVPNDRLLSVLERNTSMVEAFRVADDVLRQGVQGISDLITLPALINLDFADVRTTMRDAGPALLGIGMGTGDSRAAFASERAISSPLLETSIEGRPLDPALDHRRPRPLADRDLGGGPRDPGSRAPRGAHHLRRQRRRDAARADLGDRDRDPLRRPRPPCRRDLDRRPALDGAALGPSWHERRQDRRQARAGLSARAGRARHRRPRVHPELAATPWARASGAGRAAGAP